MFEPLHQLLTVRARSWNIVTNLGCVWLHFKKFFGKYFLVFGKEEGKHKSENTSHNLEKKNHQFQKCNQSRRDPRLRSRRDRDPRSRSRRNGAIAIRDRDHGAIAIDNTIVISTGRSRSEIAIAPNRDWWRDRDLAIDRAVGLELELVISDCIFSSRARARSLSLSHFPEMIWRENRSVKAFPWSKAFFLSQRISISRK